MSSTETVGPLDFLAHREGDSVAVAVRDLGPGPASGGFLVGPEALTAPVTSKIPLGHKFALTDLDQGDDLVEYGVRVGIATAPITAGEHVHVHNVRSARWANDSAS